MSQIISPFIRYCMALGVVPSNYEDNLTVIECLNFLIKFLNDTVIPAFNENDEHVEEIKKQIEALQKYVDSYFDSLDIQTEVDHKLDQMASSGQLADIIAQYLGLAGVLAYNTIADMAAAKNLANGSICRVLGNTNYATGDGAFYRVRTLINTDVVDGFKLVAITAAPTLVAERIPGNITKKYLFIGDSYAQGFNPDGNVTSWTTLLKSKMGLSDSECIISATGGAGFANTSNKYENIVNAMTADPAVTDVVICGGYNDLTYSESDIFNGMSTTATNLKNKFQNLKNIYVGFIGGCTNEYHGNIHTHTMYYAKSCTTIGLTYIPHLEYALYHGGFLGSDGIHPNQWGQDSIARAINAGLNGGFTYSDFYDLTIDTNQSDNFGTVDWKLHLYSENDISYLASYEGVKYLTAKADFTYNKGDLIKLGKISQNGIVGTKYYTNLQFYIGNVILQSYSTPEGYYNVPAKITIDKDGFVWLKLDPIINDTHDNYQGFGGVHQIQIPMFTIIYPTNTL